MDWINEAIPFDGAPPSDELTGKAWRVTLIRKGFNSSRTRFYTTESLQSLAAIGNVQGVKAFPDHPSARESQARPERSVKDIVGWYSDLKYEEESESVTGSLNLLESSPYPHIGSAMKEAHERGNPGLFQLSIRALGESKRGRVEGNLTNIYSSFTLFPSTDIVTMAGAGGSVDQINESENTNKETGAMEPNEVAEYLKGLTPEEAKKIIEESQPGVLEAPAETTVTTPVVEPAAAETAVQETQTIVAEVPEELTKAIQEANDATAAATAAKAAFDKANLVAKVAVDGVRLPEIIQTRLKSQVESGTITEESALKTMIEEEQTLYDSIVAESRPKMTIFKTEDADGKKLGNKPLQDAMFAMLTKKPEHEGTKAFTGLKDAYYAHQQYEGKPFTPSLTGMALAQEIISESMGYASEGIAGDPAARAQIGGSFVQEAVTMSSFAVLLGDSMNKAFLDSYRGVDEKLKAYRTILSDFKGVSRFDTYPYSRVGGYPTLPIVAEGATYNQLPTPTEEAVTLRIRKRGGTESLTMESIADDDLGKLQRIPEKLARAASLTRYRAVFDLFRANNGSGPEMPYDSTNLFHNNHKNKFGAHNDLSYTTINSAWVAMQRQLDQDAVQMNLWVEPKYLIVPTPIYPLAKQLLSQEYEHSPRQANGGAPGGGALMNASTIKGMLEPLHVPYLGGTNLGNSNWYVVADPSMYDTIIFHHYTGFEEPQITTQSNEQSEARFFSDRLIIKVWDIWDVKVADHRTFYGSIDGGNNAVFN